MFNGTNTLGATAASGVKFQIGANTTANDSVTVTGVDVTLGTSETAKAAAGAIVVDTPDNSTLAIKQIDKAIAEVNNVRATYGAVQNRFNAIVSNLQSSTENQSAAKSRIMDTDFAAETANLSRGQILQQAGTAMLAQANSLPNGVLALLR
jgi:flagellin